MTAATTNTKAAQLRSMHESSAHRVLVLPNAWDAASAAFMAAAGAQAIATTSGGIAWSLGYPDGQQLTRDDMVAAVRRIADAVDAFGIPVTADVEGGYGASAADVESTVAAAAAAGAAGINLEDSQAPGGPLFSLELQVERIRAARTAAASAEVPALVVNARTDVFLFQVGEPAGRLDEVLRRASGYAEAGADCLFVPGLLDLAVLESLVAASPLPVNAMAVPGGPSVAELAAAGVRRVSVGTCFAQAAYTLARRAAEELLSTGTYGACEGAASYAELNALFRHTE